MNTRKKLIVLLSLICGMSQTPAVNAQNVAAVAPLAAGLVQMAIPVAASLVSTAVPLAARAAAMGTQATILGTSAVILGVRSIPLIPEFVRDRVSLPHFRRAKKHAALAENYVGADAETEGKVDAENSKGVDIPEIYSAKTEVSGKVRGLNTEAAAGASSSDGKADSPVEEAPVEEEQSSPLYPCFRN